LFYAGSVPPVATGWRSRIPPPPHLPPYPGETKNWSRSIDASINFRSNEGSGSKRCTLPRKEVFHDAHAIENRYGGKAHSKLSSAKGRRGVASNLVLDYDTEK